MLNKFTFLLSSSQIVSEFQFLMQRHTVRNLHHFIQKFNFDFPRKLLIFLGEKLVKMLWLSTVKLLTTLISREKLSRKTRENVGFLSKLNFLTKI